MSTIFFYEKQLGNVLSFYAFCKRLKGRKRTRFFSEQAPIFHAYSRANAADYFRSYQDRYGHASPVPEREIIAEASASCDLAAAQETIRLLRYNALNPSRQVLAVIAELMHCVFRLAWRHKDKSPYSKIHPDAISPTLYTAADLALMGSFPALVNRRHFDEEAVKRDEAKWLAQFAAANAVLFHATAPTAAAIEKQMGPPSVEDLPRYFYLVSSLFPSTPQDSAGEVWDTVLRHYSEALTYSEYRFCL